MKADILIIIAGAGLATYLTRFPFILLSGKWAIPEWLVKWMNFIAPAVLTALIAPSVFIRNGKPDLSLSNESVLAAAITVIAAAISRNMLISVITGVCSLGLLSWLM